MIEIICNEENSDKSKQVTRGAAIRRPKNIKQIRSEEHTSELQSR